MRIAILYNIVETIEKGLEIEKISDNDVLSSVEYVRGSLEGEHEVVPLRVSRSLIAAIASSPPDFVFNLCEGFGGNVFGETYFPAVLDTLGIPYTGSNGFTLALCLNKVKAKEVLIARGVPTPRYQVFEDSAARLGSDLAFPLIVKPVHEDASVGIFADSVVHDEASLRRRVQYLLDHYHQPALVEEYIDGRELNVAILGNPPDHTVLPVYEIVFNLSEPTLPRIVSYEAKWLADSPLYTGTSRVCPAQLEPEVAERARAAALAAFTAVGCRDYGRIDIRLRDGVPYVLEVNPNPRLDIEGGFAACAASRGMGSAELVRRILGAAVRRYEGRGGSAARAAPDPLVRRIAEVYASALATEHLSASPIRLEHVALLARWFNDERTMRFMDAPGTTYSEDELREWHSLMALPEVNLVISAREGGVPIGFGYIYDIDRPNNSAELSFAIAEGAFRGRGYGHELVELLLSIAFKRLRLNSLFASVVTENAPSLAVLQRAGFRTIGRRRQSHCLCGSYYDEVLFDMTRADYDARHRGRRAAASRAASKDARRAAGREAEPPPAQAHRPV